MDLERAHVMLKQAHDDLAKNYFDPAYHGVDIEKTYHQFDERLNTAQSVNESFRIIAAYYLNLHDSLFTVFDGGGEEMAIKASHHYRHLRGRGLTVRTTIDCFTGTVTVLVDSKSASCSELFARVLQLEHRGKVIGDTSAGAVMEARGFGNSIGSDSKIFYQFSITSANLIMSDGKSLETVGVIPDDPLLPTAADLAASRDPVLAHAAQTVGLTLDPIAAGKMFPYEWPKL